MTNVALIAYTVSAAAWLLAVGMVIDMVRRNRAERPQSGPPADETDETARLTPRDREAAPEPAPARYHATSWPGPVLPEGFARAAIAQADRKLHLQREILSRRPSDAGLCGLARRDATAHDWQGWRTRVTGGDDDAGEPGRAE